jgi:S-adenosylmethionine synthetase
MQMQRNFLLGICHRGPSRQICDQISDAILDEIFARDRRRGWPARPA